MLRTPSVFQDLREVSLFSGAGGGVLASKLLGWKTVAYVEWEKFPQNVLKARIKDGLIDDAPVFGDIQEFDGKAYRGKAEVVSGGFPCQPWSVAGKRMGSDDARDMWPDTCRVISEVQPKFAFLENVGGLLSASHGYFGTILSDLADIGYEAVWDCVPASAVGAPHRRERLWILARPATLRDPETCAIVPAFAIRGPKETINISAKAEEEAKAKEKAKAKEEAKKEAKAKEASYLGTLEMFGDLVSEDIEDIEDKDIEDKDIEDKDIEDTEDEAEYRVERRWLQPGVRTSGGFREADWSRSGALLLYSDGSVRVHDTPRMSFPDSVTTRYGIWPWPTLLEGGTRDDVDDEGRSMWMTPNTFDSISPKSQDALDHEATHRKGRANLNNLRDQVNVEEGNVEWKGQGESSDAGRKMFSTPAAETHGRASYPTLKAVNALLAGEQSPIQVSTVDQVFADKMRVIGVVEVISFKTFEVILKDGSQGFLQAGDQQMWPTPRSVGGRASRRALVEIDHWGAPGLEQAVELREGILPREFQSEDELTPQARRMFEEGKAKMWPTPRTAQASMYAEDAETLAARGRDGLDTLAGAVAAEEGAPDRRMWATPTAGMSKEAWPTEGMATRSARRGGPGNLIEDMAIEMHGTDEQKEGRRMFPTPRANDWKGADLARDENRSGARHGGDDLATAIEKDRLAVDEDGRVMWPTPAAQEPSAKDSYLETLTNKDGGPPVPHERAYDPNTGVHVQVTLNRAVKMFPTPTASDGSKGPCFDETSRDGGDDLTTHVARDERQNWPTRKGSLVGGSGVYHFREKLLAEGTITEEEAEGMFDDIGRGKTDKDSNKAPAMLNPDWVEWLMNWPIGWTRLTEQPEGPSQAWSRLSVGGLWWKVEPQGLPRVTTEKTDRAVRLKALGNGQVSLCAAASCAGLYETFQQIETKLQRAAEGHTIDRDDFLGL